MHTKKQVLHNLTSLIKLALLGIAINSFSSLAQAGLAMCSPENGAAVSYENFLHEDIPASDNERGKKYEKSMNGGMQNYTIACNCTDKDASSRSGVLLMYTVKTALPKGTEPGYYKINDHIDVKASLICLRQLMFRCRRPKHLAMPRITQMQIITAFACSKIPVPASTLVLKVH